MRAPVLTSVAVFILLLAIAPTTTYASSTSPNYTINISNERISFSVGLALKQNFTLLQSSFSIPIAQGVVVGANATDATLAVQNALEVKSPGARVSNLMISGTVSSWLNTTSTQWLNLTLRFDVTGVDNARFGGDQVDLSWKSFVVVSALSFGGVEVNNIGPKYLGAPAAQIASQSISSTFVKISYRVNGRTSAQGSFLSAAATFSALNFSLLSPPFSSWTHAYDFNSNTVSWSLNAGSNLGMSIVKTISEPGSETGSPSTIGYGLFYNLYARVSAPNRASASGNALTVVFTDFPQTLMSIGIASSVILGVGAFAYEKRISIRFPKKKPKR
jgi:hypothetical protein